jgi:ATP phosphoribosyltransferase
VVARRREASFAYESTSTIRVATKYPRVASNHFLARGVSAEVVRLAGSVEIAPGLGLADCIVDVVETGRTLEENGLTPVEDIAASSARLIVNRASFHARREEVGALLQALRSGVQQEGRNTQNSGSLSRRGAIRPNAATPSGSPPAPTRSDVSEG